MTQEEKLEEAKRLYKTANSDQRYVLESLFPELKESEDERIRGAIIDIIKSQKEQQCHIDSTIYDEMIAWLKKQGEKNEIFNVPSREVILSIWEKSCCPCR